MNASEVLFAAHLAFVPLLTSGQPVQTADTPTGHIERMAYLDNGVIRLGVDLNLGGAITYLSRSGTNAELNLINSHDWGRQVQLSYYSGPNPFRPPGARANKDWEGLGWNPIQSGDCFGNAARVLEHTNSAIEMYLKCIPMQWPLDNVPGECNCEIWLSLDGPAVKARCRLNNRRSDHTQYSPRSQESPAVYVNGPFYRLFTYRGDKPFTRDALSQIQKRPGDTGPWASWTATENWAAQVNDEGFGLGVWNPGAVDFIGGFAGQPGAGGPKDDPTGYISPLLTEMLDWNIVYDYNYELIVGTLEEIREHVYRRHSSQPAPLSWTFEKSRQGWHYTDAADQGWPVRDELAVSFAGQHPQILSPTFFTRTENCPRLAFLAAFEPGCTNARVYWRGLEQPFSEVRSVSVNIPSDSEFHHFEIDLSAQPGYKGTLVQLRLDPIHSGQKGVRLHLKSVRLGLR